MNNNQTPPSENSSHDKKWLVRILLIIGIGVPIFIEVFTFSGLISAHLFDYQSSSGKTIPKRADTLKTARINAGDTLFTEHDFPILITSMQLDIYQNRWIFNMRVKALSTNQKAYDSIRLVIGKLVTQQNTIQESRSVNWDDKSFRSDSLSWRLSSGERPEKADLALIRTRSGSLNPDTLAIQRSVPFGHIPARYIQ